MLKNLRTFVTNNAGNLVSYLIGLLLSAVARLIPSALDRALKGLNDVEALLARAAAKAQARLDAEAAKRTALYDQIGLSYGVSDDLDSELARAQRIRNRIANLIA